MCQEPLVKCDFVSLGSLQYLRIREWFRNACAQSLESGGSGIDVLLVMILCTTYGAMSQSSGTPSSRSMGFQF